MRLTVRLTRARAPETGEGASQSLQGLELETVEQPNRNFREIQRGRSSGKILKPRKRDPGDRGPLPLQAASDIHLPCLRGVFFGISGRIAGERSRPGEILRRITPERMARGGLRMARRAPPPSRMRIYPFLHRNGERGPQGPGNGPQGLKDGKRRREKQSGRNSVKSHDGTRAPQPPLSTPPGRIR